MICYVKVDLNGTKRIMVSEKILDFMRTLPEIHHLYVYIGSQRVHEMLRDKITGKYSKKNI